MNGMWSRTDGDDWLRPIVENGENRNVAKKCPILKTKCMRERCEFWDECVTERNGIVIRSNFKPGCALIQREYR